jgi:hypothetical protein
MRFPVSTVTGPAGQIEIHESTGGGHSGHLNRTSSVQLREYIGGHDGYILRGSVRFSVGNRDSFNRAVEKAAFKAKNLLE